MKINPKIAITLGLVLFTAACIAFAFDVFHRQFGGYDLSPLIDFQYRLSTGQIPGRSFILTFPASLGLLLQVENWIAAPTWFGLLWVNCALFAFCIACLGAFWPREFEPWKLVLTSLLLALPLLYTNHIWHSAMTQWIAIVYCVVCLSALGKDGRAKIARMLLAAVAGLLFFSKQNLGAPLVVATSFALMGLGFVQPAKRRVCLHVVVIQVLGVLATAVVIMLCLHMGVATLVHTFTYVLGRARVSRQQEAALPFKAPVILAAVVFSLGYLLTRAVRRSRTEGVDPLIVALLAAALIGMAVYERNYDAILMAAICLFLGVFLVSADLSAEQDVSAWAIWGTGLLVSVLPLITDWDSKYNDAVLPAVSMICLSRPRAAVTRNLLVGGVVVSLLGAATGGWVRQRMHDVGPGVFWEDARLITIREGYFDGLAVGPHMIEVRKEMLRALREIPHPDGVFCGPRIEFCYADLGLRSPLGLPLWWHPGTSYPMQAQGAVVRAFARDHFSLLMFVKGDRTRMPAALLALIARDYSSVEGFEALDVYVPRRESGTLAASRADQPAPAR